MLTKDLKLGQRVKFINTTSGFMDMIVVHADHKEIIVHRPYILMEHNVPYLKVEILAPFQRDSSMEWILLP
jgi:hypothetical protein